jgi:aspartate carbamoyltransferase catalytic subunit
MELLDNETVLELIELALQYKNGQRKTNFSDRYAVNCFFEDSTRTHKSFEMAERKLGMQLLDFQPSTSSVKKGETLYDTVLTLQAIGVDLVVIRHGEEAYYEELINSPTIHCAIVNGGDGAGQHPSQCLLDLVTIYEEFQTFKDLKIAIAGDLTHSRVARSNMQMLKRLGAELFFTGPKEWYDPTFDQYGEYKEIDELVEDVDVMMLLRVQHERHQKQMSFSQEEYLNKFGLTHEREQRMKEKAIIMHPAPVNRGVEIAYDLVECQRARIVRQMQNGVFARMAIIEAVLDKK